MHDKVFIIRNERNTQDRWLLYRVIWRLHRRILLGLFVTLINRHADIIQPEHQGAAGIELNLTLSLSYSSSFQRNLSESHHTL